jgi:hypothetical protein
LIRPDSSSQSIPPITYFRGAADAILNDKQCLFPTADALQALNLHTSKSDGKTMPERFAPTTDEDLAFLAYQTNKALDVAADNYSATNQGILSGVSQVLTRQITREHDICDFSHDYAQRVRKIDPSLFNSEASYYLNQPENQSPIHRDGNVYTLEDLPLTYLQDLGRGLMIQEFSLRDRAKLKVRLTKEIEACKEMRIHFGKSMITSSLILATGQALVMSSGDSKATAIGGTIAVGVGALRLISHAQDYQHCKRLEIATTQVKDRLFGTDDHQNDHQTPNLPNLF